MAALAPPPDIPKAPATGKAPAAANRDNDTRHWTERLSRSGYFLGAVLLHIVVFLIVATWVIFRAPPPPQEDFEKTYVQAQPPPPPPPPPEETVKVPSSKVSMTTTPIMTSTPMPTFNVPLPNLTTSPVVNTHLTQMQHVDITVKDNLAARLPGIKAMEMSKWGRSRENILESNGDPKNVIATFPLYLASYADGDWGCNVQIDSNGIVAGSLPDLVNKINEWGHGSLKGHVVPSPLDIGSPDLMDKMPPFVFFTGHKDFQLTDDEVANLRKYLQNGGAIWGDNSLPGYGSRFDVAFRREMKKVIPDKDKNFEDLKMDHPIFRGWFPTDHVPSGMNFYHEPIQHLDLDGKLAILYTPNDYGDLFYMNIARGDESDLGTGLIPGSPLFTNPVFYNYSPVFFRNFTLPSCLEAQKFGMNVIGHLLVRFDKDLLLSP